MHNAVRWTWYFEYKIFLGICCWSFGCLLNFYHSHFLIYSLTSRLLYFCRFLLCMLLVLSRNTKCLVIFYCNGYTPLPKVIWTVVGSLLPSANCVSGDLLQMRRLAMREVPDRISSGTLYLSEMKYALLLQYVVF